MFGDVKGDEDGEGGKCETVGDNLHCQLKESGTPEMKCNYIERLRRL